MTPSLNVVTDRPEHPLDVVERLASINEWAFDRGDEDEISILVSGAWTQYEVAFTWLPDIESLHVGCSFDLKASPAAPSRATPNAARSSRRRSLPARTTTKPSNSCSGRARPRGKRSTLQCSRRRGTRRST
jgi:hypothetical protein